MAPLLLVVDDEPDLLDALALAFRRRGYRVETATTGRAALERTRREPRPDLVVLDLMLPDMGGTEVCRRIRSHPATASMPVVMLTARGEEDDRVRGFEAGADDYVVKPFSTRELLLRVRAVLRRGRPAAEGELRAGPVALDPEAHRAWVGERELDLTALEFRLLHALLRRPGRAWPRDALIDAVWGEAPPETARAVDTTVRRLRVKLGEAGDLVETVRGVGYRLRGDG